MLIRVNITHFFLVVVLISLYYNLNIFVYFTNGVSYLFDLTSRINLNDSIINSFNFFWTSFTYLPTFFFTPLLTLLVYLNLYNHLILLVPCLWSYFLFLVETVDFSPTNYNSYLYSSTTSNINLLLSNNLNKYHPFIFYLSVFTLFNFVMSSITFFKDNYLFLNNHLGSNNKLMITNLYINVLALFLGSWWALQEGTWGGWWNWDASEVFGLLISLSIIFKVHLKSTTTNTLAASVYWISVEAIIVLVYYFIQLNFDLVSHNFGSRFVYFFSNNLFFLELIGILCILLIKSYYINMNYKNKTNLLLTRNQSNAKYFLLKYWVLKFLSLCLLLILFNSFIPLINYFLWSYFLINNFNFNLTLVVLLLILLTLLLKYFLLTNTTLLFCIVVALSFNLYSVILLVPCFIILNKSNLTILHLYILIFTTINLNSQWVNFIQWSNLNIYESLIQNSLLLSFKQITFTCDYLFIEKSQLYSISSLKQFSFWNTYFKTNSCTLSSFLLYYDYSTFFNHYLVLNNWINTILYIETNLLNNLTEVFTLFPLLILLKFFFHKYLFR